MKQQNFQYKIDVKDTEDTSIIPNETAHNVAETLSHQINHMTDIQETPPPVTELSEAMELIIADNTMDMPTAVVRDMKTMSGNILCGDGRKDGDELADKENGISNIQTFGGTSGYSLGTLGGIHKGLGKYLSEDDIIALDTAYVNKLGINHEYEHSDNCKEYADGHCGCGHLQNLRGFKNDSVETFGLTPKLVDYHRGLMKQHDVTPDILPGGHKERAIVIVFGSKHKGGENNEEDMISTIISNKKNEQQFFVVNLDGVIEITQEKAKILADIMHSEFADKAREIEEATGKSVEDALFDSIIKGICDQTVDTAKKLAPGLFKDSTFVWNGTELTKADMNELAKTLPTFGA